VNLLVSSALSGLVGSVVALVLGFVLLRTRTLPFDRRGRIERGRFDLPLTSGTCVAVTPVTVPVEPSAAAGLVVEALRRVRATDVATLDPWTVAGWEGVTWRSFGQQVGVVMQPTGPSEVTLWCCSRPRVATTLIDWGAGQRSVQALASELRRLASNS
jgi:hypothetical protein